MFEVVEFVKQVGPIGSATMVGTKVRGLASMEAASAAAQRYAAEMELSGENKEHGYWWGRRAGSKRMAIFVPQAEFDLEDLQPGG